MTNNKIILNLVALIADVINANNSPTQDTLQINVLPQEFSIGSPGNTFTHYLVSDFTDVHTAIHDIVMYMWNDEYKSFLESGEPDDHIFHKLKVLKGLMPLSHTLNQLKSQS